MLSSFPLYNWPILAARASVKLFELGVRTPGGLFLGIWYARGWLSIFGVFRTPSLPIFGVILGLLEATKMYKLF